MSPVADWQLARTQLALLKDVSGWANVQTRVMLAHTSLLLGDRIGAETMLREARDYPGPPTRRRPSASLRWTKLDGARPSPAPSHGDRIVGPDDRGAPRAALPADQPVARRDRQPALRVALHRQDPLRVDLPQAQRQLALRRRGARPATSDSSSRIPDATGRPTAAPVSSGADGRVAAAIKRRRAGRDEHDDVGEQHAERAPHRVVAAHRHRCTHVGRGRDGRHRDRDADRGTARVARTPSCRRHRRPPPPSGCRGRVSVRASPITVSARRRSSGTRLNSRSSAVAANAPRVAGSRDRSAAPGSPRSASCQRRSTMPMALAEMGSRSGLIAMAPTSSTADPVSTPMPAMIPAEIMKSRYVDASCGVLVGPTHDLRPHLDVGLLRPGATLPAERLDARHAPERQVVRRDAQVGQLLDDGVSARGVDLRRQRDEPVRGGRTGRDVTDPVVRGEDRRDLVDQLGRHEGVEPQHDSPPHSRTVGHVDRATA